MMSPSVPEGINSDKALSALDNKCSNFIDSGARFRPANGNFYIYFSRFFKTFTYKFLTFLIFNQFPTKKIVL